MKIEHFCSDDITRYSINRPFIHGDYVVATNGHVAVFQEKDSCEYAGPYADAPPDVQFILEAFGAAESKQTTPLDVDCGLKISMYWDGDDRQQLAFSGNVVDFGGARFNGMYLAALLAIEPDCTPMARVGDGGKMLIVKGAEFLAVVAAMEGEGETKTCYPTAPFAGLLRWEPEPTP